MLFQSRLPTLMPRQARQPAVPCLYVKMATEVATRFIAQRGIIYRRGKFLDEVPGRSKFTLRLVFSLE
ncbi:MAG: hypothetical protein NVS4B1_32700 [Ktedonobacteraceae bacterium]